MSTPCPLCDKLVNLRELPDDQLVWEFPHSIALLGPWQYHTGYCVLIARSHETELHRLLASERIAFLEEMTLLSQAIDMTFQPRKMNCELLGNQVPHLHWHLFPRRADDPENLKAVWIAFERAEQDEPEKQRLQTARLPRHEIVQLLRSTLRHLHAPTP